MSATLAQPILKVEEAVRLYQERNPLLQAERERVEGARGRLRQAGLLPNPQLNFSQEGFPLGTPGTSYLNDQEFLFWGTQEFELGGKRRHRRRAAELDLEASKSDLEDFVRRGTAAVKEAFARAYLAQAKLRLASEHLDLYYKIREIHRHRVEAGDASGLSQLRVDMEEVRYLTAAGKTGLDWSAAWSELAALIAWEQADPPVLELPVDTPPLERSLDELQEVALEARPDLRAEKARVEESAARLDLEKSRAIPNLNLGGGYKRDFGTHSFYLILNLPLPLLNRNQGNIGEALANVRQNENRLAWKKLQIQAEVQRAFQAYRLQQGHVERLKQEVLERAHRTLEITQQSYREGEATLLDYLDALRVRLDAALGFYDLLFQLQRARVELEEAVGAELR